MAPEQISTPSNIAQKVLLLTVLEWAFLGELDEKFYILYCR